ncbi:hypothetical protein K1719_042266 [Acacia pycnantha]|nr:hypothetical protein K1719_042266 [Acacia pycnantha]
MASLFPSEHQTIRSGFLLVLHLLSTFMSFLWLEFSQSFQVLVILFTTLVYSLVYGYRFWTTIGFHSVCFPFVFNCQIVLLGCNLISHVGVFLLHFFKGGYIGIGAWILNSVLNCAILMLFLNFYVRMYLGKRAKIDVIDGIESKLESTSVLSLSAGREVDMPKLKSIRGSRRHR